jgi:hypothetical protein
MILAKEAGDGGMPMARTARAASSKTHLWLYGYSILKNALVVYDNSF